MASTSVFSPFNFCKMFRNSTQFHRAPNITYSLGPKVKLRHEKLSHYISKPMRFSNCNGSRRKSRMVAADGAHESGPREEHRALETVLKLYEAIKNKNVNQLSDIIAEECSCVSNFVSAFQPFLGKKQVLGFFLCLMKSLGNNIEIVVQQTLDHGMVIGVSWKLEWKKVPLRLGKGFSLYTCHIYQGKVMIRNVEMFLEPLLHMEPIRLKLMSVGMDMINPHTLLKNRATKAVILFFILIFLAALVRLCKYGAPT